MRTLTVATLSVLAFLASSVPASADTPQQITEKMVQTIEEHTPVDHGPNMTVYVARQNFKSKPTYIDADCAGRDAEITAATAAGTPPPPSILLSKRVYGRAHIDLHFCSAPNEVGKRLPMPLPVRHAYYRLKVRAMLRACHLVAKAAKKVQKPDKPFHVSCRHLKAVGSNGSTTVLQYYGHGKSKKKILAISLQSDGLLKVRKRDRVTVDVYPNRQLQ